MSDVSDWLNLKIGSAFVSHMCMWGFDFCAGALCHAKYIKVIWIYNKTLETCKSVFNISEFCLFCNYTSDNNCETIYDY